MMVPKQQEQEQQQPNKQAEHPDIGYYFLTPSAVDNIRTYQYSGEDRSLLYKYVLSPFSLYWVNNWTPTTMAPNTITLTGLIFMIISYMILWFYCPDVTAASAKKIPSWPFYLNCIAMLTYQTMDNMDGKQARRTGSSSSLGLLFDHGCDSFNSIVGSVNWVLCMGLDVTQSEHQFAVWLFIIAPMTVFYVTTWEEFHTGHLDLPIINGPSEGLALGAMFSLTTALYGVQFWHTDSFMRDGILPALSYVLPSNLIEHSIPLTSWLEGTKNYRVIVGMVLFLSTRETLIKYVHVSRKYGLASLLGMAPMLFMAASFFLIGYLDEGALFMAMPRTTFHLCSGIFVEIVMDTMRCHVTKQQFPPLLRLALLPLAVGVVAMAVAVLVLNIHTEPYFVRGAEDYILSYCTGMWVYLACKNHLLLHEICSALNIWCFDIVTPRPLSAIAQQKMISNSKVTASNGTATNHDKAKLY